MVIIFIRVHAQIEGKYTHIQDGMLPTFDGKLASSNQLEQSRMLSAT